MPRHKVWEQKGEEYRLIGGGGFSWTGGVGTLRTRKRRRDITWPDKEQKNAKIQKLEEVVGVVKKRKEGIKKRQLDKIEVKAKLESSDGMFMLLSFCYF